MANVTKRDLVIALSNEGGHKHAEVEGVIERFVDLVSRSLAEGKDVTLRGFGTLEIRVAKAKIGRNPNRPGSDVRIPDRCVIRFKPGRELKERVARLPVDVVVKEQSVLTSNGTDPAA